MLYLASASPRRKEILERAGFSFTAMPTQADESFPAGEQPPPREAAAALARRKALALAESPAYWAVSRPGDEILAADTVVDLDGRLLGKPAGEAEAAAMLRALSGRAHLVHTGFCLTGPRGTFSTAETTRVEFYPLSEEEILAYIASGEPMDKAGAYGIQGRGMRFVRRIEGDFFNVMGLPVSCLRAL